MNEVLEIIKKQREEYPLMQLQDIVKLIYQNEFGPGHFVKSKELSMQRLRDEYREIKENAGGKVRRIESIGNGLCRCYLQGLKEEELKALNRIFVHSANHRQGSKAVFEKKLLNAKSLLKEMDVDFTEREYTAYIREQREKGYPPVSHSEAYRKAYHPSYRVIEEKFAPYISLLAEIETLIQKKKNPVIGIDGNAAAGKTTLSQCLKELYGSEVIHMDEFFLPGEMRTLARMEEIGGNIHYERFAAEVVNGIRSNTAFTYRIFSCHEMDYTGTKKISNRKMLVIEGSYSMREDFREAYDYKIFLKLPAELQKQRIIERNGMSMYEMFRDKWIPMENRYFESGKIEALCDYCYLWK